jgi:MoxR-like ATPase
MEGGRRGRVGGLDPMLDPMLDTTRDPQTLDDETSYAARHRLCLVILWSISNQERAGELMLVPERGVALIGRGPPPADEVEPRLTPVRWRPSGWLDAGPLTEPGVSRVQLRVRAEGSDAVRLENVGRCPLLADGRPVDAIVMGEGDMIELKSQLVLSCVRRGPLPSVPEDWDAATPFGRPDPYGIVGESEAAWRLRSQIAFAAARGAHVLVTGPSGAGKEATARAIHLRSSRAARPLVARNAATLPETLVDAELFGNRKDYPNPGMPERPGLIGEACDSTLFLDEIGELSEVMQARLLRVLDAGEYHRLGESRARRSDLRLVAATNRDPETLKHDLRARFAVHIELPGLDERREDIPSIACELVRRVAREDPEIAERFFLAADLGGSPLLSPTLVRALVSMPWTTHARELMQILWASLRDSPDRILICPAGLRPAKAAGSRPSRAPGSISEEEIRASIERNGGRLEDVWRELGLTSRYVLRRLMARHQITR